MFVNLDTTFTALASIARPFLQESISEGPPSEEVAIREFPKQRPFLRNNAAFFRELRPGVATLPHSAPILADAFEAGTEILPETPPAERRPRRRVRHAGGLLRGPAGAAAAWTSSRGCPPRCGRRCNFLTPVQTTCNYATLFFRNASSVLSQGDQNGNWQRFTIIPTTPRLEVPPIPYESLNNEIGPSSGPANGPGAENHLHANPYPNTASPGQTKECEAGNERFAEIPAGRSSATSPATRAPRPARTRA